MVHGRNREEEAQQRKVGNRKQEAESRKQEIGKRERVLTKGRRDLHRLSTYFHFHFHFWGAFFFHGFRGFSLWVTALLKTPKRRVFRFPRLATPKKSRPTATTNVVVSL